MSCINYLKAAIQISLSILFLFKALWGKQLNEVPYLLSNDELLQYYVALKNICIVCCGKQMLDCLKSQNTEFKVTLDQEKSTLRLPMSYSLFNISHIVLLSFKNPGGQALKRRRTSEPIEIEDRLESLICRVGEKVNRLNWKEYLISYVCMNVGLFSAVFGLRKELNLLSYADPTKHKDYCFDYWNSKRLVL